MTKTEYLQRLKIYLEHYYGDTAEILSNYETIIDELLGEGLTMTDIIERLGSPAVLSEEIVREFHLEYKKKVGLPLWAKIVFIVLGVMFFVPIVGTIFGIIMSIVGLLFGIFMAAVATIFFGIVISVSVWFDPNLMLVFKIVFTGTSIAITLSLVIIFYFIFSNCIVGIKYLSKQCVKLGAKIKNSF